MERFAKPRGFVQSDSSPGHPADGRQPLLDALTSRDVRMQAVAVEQLERVKPGQRAFARTEIEAIANDPAQSVEFRDKARLLLTM